MENGLAAPTPIQPSPVRINTEPDAAERPEADAMPDSQAPASPPAASPSAFDPRPDLPSAHNYKLMHTLTEHTSAVACVRFQRDGPLAATASGDKTAKIWDVNAGRSLHTFDKHEDGLNDVAWSWDGTAVATASDDSHVRVWDVRSGECIRKLSAHTSYVTCCAFTANGNELASAGYDETIRFWCMHTGRLVRSVPAHSDPILSLDFSADISKPVLASASSDGICRVWYGETGECGRSIIPDPSVNPSLPVTFCKFTPNNKFLLLGSLTGRLQLWEFEPKRGQLQGMAPLSVKKTYLGHVNKRYALQASFVVNEPSGNNNKYVVCGSEEHHVYLWDLNQRNIKGILRGRATADSPGDGHCDVVHSVDTSAVDPIIGSGGGEKDKTLKVWRYKAQRECVICLTVFMDFGIASFAAFSVGKLIINDLESSVADTETMAPEEAKKSKSRENILPIDTRLRIFWPKDNQFYPGKVSGHETANGFFYHAIEYDDGMIETRLNMAQELYAVIPAGRPRDPRLPHHQEAVQPPPGTVTPETGSGLVGMERDTAQMQMTMTGNASLAGNLPQQQQQQQQQQQVEEERLQSTEVVNNDDDDEEEGEEQTQPRSASSEQQQQEEVDSAKRKFMEEMQKMYDGNERYHTMKRQRRIEESNARNTEKQLEEETKRRQAAQAALKEEEKRRQTAEAVAAAVNVENQKLEEEVKAQRAEIADCKRQLQIIANTIGWKGFEAHSG